MLFLSLIWLGCFDSIQCHPDKDFLLEYQNCILVVVNHQALLYKGDYSSSGEAERIEKAIRFLEEVTGSKSHIIKEYPAYYLGDSTLSMDVNFWINWYNNAPCEFKENPYDYLGINNEIQKEDLFPTPLMK